MAKGAGSRWTDERRRLALAIYESGQSLQDVAKAMGSNGSRTAAAIRAVGGTIRGKGRPMDQNPAWKGGRFVDHEGYVHIRIPSHPNAVQGSMREHRLVMEQMIGRYLDRDEVVHHVNGIRDDNRPENLQLFPSNASHLAHELKGKCPNWTPEGRARIGKYQRQSPRQFRSKSGGVA